MDPELWDEYAAKFGESVAVENLGPRPVSSVTPVDPELWDEYAEKFGIDVATRELGVRGGIVDQPPSPTLSPGVGGLLDFLNAATLPFTAAFEDRAPPLNLSGAPQRPRGSEELSELQRRSRKGAFLSALAGGLGAGTSLGSLSQATRLSRIPRPKPPPPDPYIRSALPTGYGSPVPFGRTVQVLPKAAPKPLSAQLLRLVRSKYLRGALGAEVLRRAFSNRQ